MWRSSACSRRDRGSEAVFGVVGGGALVEESARRERGEDDAAPIHIEPHGGE